VTERRFHEVVRHDDAMRCEHPHCAFIVDADDLTAVIRHVVTNQPDLTKEPRS
jgi:hypothetical protein